MTNLCDRVRCESIYGAYIINCLDQNLCAEIISHLASIQQGDAEPKEFLIPKETREATEAL